LLLKWNNNYCIKCLNSCVRGLWNWVSFAYEMKSNPCKCRPTLRHRTNKDDWCINYITCYKKLRLWILVRMHQLRCYHFWIVCGWNDEGKLFRTESTSYLTPNIFSDNWFFWVSKANSTRLSIERGFHANYC